MAEAHLISQTKPMSPPATAGGKEAIGVVAGWGRFPVLFAEAARAAGYELVCIGIRGLADPELQRLAAKFYWVGVAQLGRMIRLLRREGVKRAAFAGKVHKSQLFQRWRAIRHLPDWRFIKCYLSRSRSDNRDDSLMLAAIAEYEKDGIKIVSALEFCPELLVEHGCLTKRRPTKSEWRDVAFGWKLAKAMGGLDVGQSVAVKERAVLAVEAIEGTDAAISRAGQLCSLAGFVVVKVAKPQQDMRFDVPAVGPGTIETMHQAGARVLAIEAGKTIVVDRERTVELADRYGISIVAIHDGEAEAATRQAPP